MNGNPGTFERGVLPLPPKADFVAQLVRQEGITAEQAEYHFDRLTRDEVWVSEQYQVNIDRDPPHRLGDEAEVWHLSIKRRDKAPIHDWRDLQAIKNQLVGPEFEAVELYPAEARVVDSANQYHLWTVIRLGDQRAPRLPFGWTVGLVRSESPVNGRQRPLENA